ncbi:MAG: T9SS type A sorting domain-containing protein [Bacteroidetes bacterium]|nr:T9SS type A sorting domain-containing protein [Bacteroidota bacterium]
MVEKNTISSIVIAQRSKSQKLFFVFLCSMLLLSISSFSATYYSRISGNWNSASTWSTGSCGGTVAGAFPVAGDIVIICVGHNVSLTANQSVANLDLNGTGTLLMNTAGITLTVSGNLTMDNTSAINNSALGTITVGGTFNVLSGANCVLQNVNFSVTGTTTITGTLTQNNGNSGVKSFGNLTIAGTWTNTASNVPISISGNMINNGTFNQGTGRVTFTGATSNTITGTSTSAFSGITVNKGASQANIIDVQSLITLTNGGLTLTNGTFELTSASTIVPFTSDPTPTILIPPNARLWCNGGTINSTVSFNWTLSGTLQVSAGTINFGSVLGDRIAPQINAATVNISGGALNATGRISNGTQGWTYIMSGGILTLGTIGNNSGGYDVFNMDNATCSFTMTSGRIIIERSGGTVGQNLGYHNVGTVGGGFTGGTLQIGDASTPAGNIMRVETDIPIYNLEVSSANATALIVSPAAPVTTSVVIRNNVNITSGVLDIGTGNGGGTPNTQDLFVGGNWTNASGALDPFIQGTKKVTFNGSSGTQTISSSGAGAVNGTTFYDVTFNNTSVTVPQIITTANVAITHTLTMTLGKVNLSGTTLTLGTGNTVALAGTLSYTAGWLYGGTFTRWINSAILPIANARGHFPMGSPTDYHPLWFGTSAAMNSGGTFSVTHNPSGPGSVPIVAYTDLTWLPGVHSVVGISNSAWTIDNTGILLGGPDGLLRYGGTGFNVFLSADINASNSTTAVGSYSAPTNVVVGSYLEVNRTNLANGHIGNKVWYIGTTDLTLSPLPIELLSFDAKSNQKVVDLNWSTATETNSDYFTIEKTKDGSDFETVGTTDGAGNSTSVLNYATKDNSPFEGISYYRLKQTDFNGVFTYSDLKMVDFHSSSDFSFDVYPNPNNGDNFNISLNAGQGEEVVVVVYDAIGKVAYSKVITTQNKGENVFVIDPSSKLSPGIYMISASSQQGVYNKKMIVK